jgi:hypothetical protein
MTSVTAAARARPLPSAPFAATVFASAALLFVVEPMAAKLVLPLLGGGPSIWNTSLAFFQAALLAGYAYAHLLQRLPSLRGQAAVHVAVVGAAALVLPLRVHELFGPPSSEHPALWLLGVLAVSIGPPFAALSATAPLVQAWSARVSGDRPGSEPYPLYAASNLGSLLALIAYPVAIEPLATLHGQRLGWSLGYAGFAALLAGLAAACGQAPGGSAPVRQAAAPSVTWRQRLTWLALAAIPSSLMLGVTTHITTDVASAPFLWVAPLALYLLSFVVAFQATPAIPPRAALLLQGAAVAGCAALLPFKASGFLLQLAVHLSAFFLTALVCHQALVARRPAPARLTEFYLWMSAGGVVGGAFNAFLAPVVFSDVWEYPIVLTLSVLARPWGDDRPAARTWALVVVGAVAGLLVPVLAGLGAAHLTARPIPGGASVSELAGLAGRLMLATAAVAAFLLRDRALLFCSLVAVLSIGAQAAADKADTLHSWRSFFGVMRESRAHTAALGGPVNFLAHGTTLHGAQALDPRWRCHPLVYYTPLTPIGQVILEKEREQAAIRMGVVGLGTGSVAAYVRPTDRLTFFEIDPLVVRIATNPRDFSYTTECAKGPVDYVLGDARLTLARQPPGVFDILLIDAFSSDAVPTHLLTVEAVRGYLGHLTPDGVLILHLSNRNLDLLSPAQAVARELGAAALVQRHAAPPDGGARWESAEDAVILARSPQALTAFARDGRWTPIAPQAGRPWTDDYTNVAGALWRRLEQRWAWLP